jgi:hypothetical protein
MAKSRNIKKLAPRFGIGEWYGMSFVKLTPHERKSLAEVALTPKRSDEMLCPFRDGGGTAKCTKKGGVCSLRLYETSDGVHGTAVSGPEGDLRAVCPHRFKQNGTIYATIGQVLLNTQSPRIVDEVRFLQRFRDEPSNGASSEEIRDTENTPVDETGKEDVGNIDNVLVHPSDQPLRWCALEIQAVYFSGKGMSSLFRSIKEYDGPGIPFPDAVRRPDYRSSGPKRLMPQLQIKVPTLRRWGKKMAVVVDAGFYRALGKMEQARDLSNADIAWFVVSYDETGPTAILKMEPPYKQTLERAVEGLTGGEPVSLGEFEDKIIEKLGR